MGGAVRIRISSGERGLGRTAGSEVSWNLVMGAESGAPRLLLTTGFRDALG